MKLTTLLQILIQFFFLSHFCTSITLPSGQYYKTTVTSRTTIEIQSTDTFDTLASRTSRDHEPDPSIIYFPSTTSALNYGAVGQRCVTFYAEIGTCQPTYSCFQERSLFQAQLLVHCGVRNKQNLICCPDNAFVASKPKKNPTQPKPEPIHFVQITEPTKKVSPTVSETEQESVPTTPRQSIPTEDHTLSPTASSQKLNDAITKTSSFLQPERINTAHTPLNNEITTTGAALQQTCGLFNESSQNDASWPWIVSIGHQSQDGTIRWQCLGSLITTEYIITSALCLQQDPNIIAIGIPLLGTTTKMESSKLELKLIVQFMIHANFISPFLYKNIGMVQISSITVSAKLMPICFPFLASVLDIIHFKGYKAKAIGFKFPGNLKEINNNAYAFGQPCVNFLADKILGLEFQTEEFRILGNEQCSRIFENRKEVIVESFPRGIQSDNVCVGTKDRTNLCQAPGGPLVLFDEASSSNVLIGIASGDPSCSKFNRQLVTFTRMNAYSTWVRQRVATFPTPPPCYY